MDRPEPRVPKDALHAGSPEDAIPAGDFQCPVHDPIGRIGRVILGADQLKAPGRTVIHAVAPVLGHLVQVRADALEIQRQLGNRVIQFGVNRRSEFQRSDCQR